MNDESKPTPGELKALEQIAKQRGSHTLLKDDKAAECTQRELLRQQGQTPAKWSEPADRGGHADWTQFNDIAHDLTQPPAIHPSPGLWDALERFVHLGDAGLELFRESYPAFLPTWFYSISCGNSEEPNFKPGLLAWQAWRNLLREAWHSNFHPEYVAQLVNVPTVPPGNTQFEVQPVCDAQRAVLAMALEPWRARFCSRCGLPFVARKAADKYWPESCFVEQRREKQRLDLRRARQRATQSKRRSLRRRSRPRLR